MYGFTGLYGNPYGLTITGRTNVPATNTQGQVKSSTIQTQMGVRRVPRITEGETVYERQKVGQWQIVAGPFTGRTVYPPPAATGDTYLRLEDAWRRGQTDITPWKPGEDEIVEDTGDDGGDDSPPPPDYTRLIVGGLVIAGGIAGVVYILRKKKGGT